MTKSIKPEYEIAYKDIINLMRKHDKISSVELLAVASNLVGKIIAMQDQRTMTNEKIMKIVADNIEIGNKQVILEVSKSHNNEKI